MANVYPAKVGRTINYKTTVSGIVKWRPAIITAVINATTCDARVGHHGETYAAIVRRDGGDMHWAEGGTRTDLDKWRPG